jgi:pimeloyl-ACP methyl ester carboxylesterase
MAFANDDRRNVDALFVVVGKNPHTSRTKRGPLELEMRERITLEVCGYPFVTAVYLLLRQQVWPSVARRIVRLALASSLLLFLMVPEAPGQTPQDAPQTKTTDFEYRKFDDLVSFLRARNAQQYAISSPKGIDESQFVTIGGIEQWVTIRGWDRDNPVLLFLHGGPGDVTNPWTFALFAPWEKHFTVVQWDQRGAGRTLRKTGGTVAPTITVDRMVQDGIELSEYLRKHLSKDKIIIVGHSFGSIIGVLMARAKPDLFYAYVGTGQVADETKNYFVAYDALLKKAQTVGNQQAFDELSRVGPPPYPSGGGYVVQRKWANAFEGADQFLWGTIGLTLVAPGNSVQDINDSVDGQMLSGERLVPETKSSGPKDLGLEFSIPMFFIQGAEDFTTPTALARNYLNSIKAPRKEFVTINSGGHFAVFMHSDQFLQELVKLVGPLTVNH